MDLYARSRAALATGQQRAIRHQSSPTTYLLRAGIARCAECSSTMHCEMSHGRPTYRCGIRSSPYKDKCVSQPTIGSLNLDATVWGKVTDIITNPALLDNLLASQELPPDDMPQLDKRLRDLDRMQANGARELIMLGEDAATPVRREMERLSEQRTNLLQQKHALMESRAATPATLEEIRRRVLERAQRPEPFTYAEKRSLLEALAVRVLVSSHGQFAVYALDHCVL